jgi:hypothetical protein
VNDLSFDTTNASITDFFHQQPKPKKTGKAPVAVKRSPYKGQPVEKAVGRVWLVRGNKEKVFASEEGARKFAAMLTAQLRKELLEDNLHGVKPEQIPEPTSDNFLKVLNILTHDFGWGRPDFIHIIEMGVFA